MFEILRDYGVMLLIGQFPHGPLGGLSLTLLLAATGLICAFPLAVLFGVARTSPWRPLRLGIGAVVHSVRGLPVLMLIFWAYFIIPLLTGYSVSGLTTVVCALIVYEIAFLSEVVRAGIQAIPTGQVEASRSLGLSYFATMRRIVLPQALYQMIPSILNQFINLVKNTSLGYIISVNELTYSAYQINAQLLTKPFQVYVILAAIYFLICWSLSLAANKLEKSINASRSGLARSH